MDSDHSSVTASVVVPADILRKCEKLILREQGKSVREGVELLLQSNLLLNDHSPPEEGDGEQADSVICNGISWLMKYPHAALGVAINADVPTIRKAFKKLALKYHPDKNPSTKVLFQAISSSCETLCYNKSTGGEVCGEDSNRAKYEQYRDNFFQRHQEEQRQREQERKKEKEHNEEQDIRREKQRQRAEEEKARSEREAEEEEANWRSQRQHHKQRDRPNDSGEGDNGSTTDQSQGTVHSTSRSKKKPILPTMHGDQKWAGRLSSMQSRQEQMLSKEELQWRKLQRDYEKLVSQVNKGEEKIRKYMEQHKLDGHHQQHGSLPALHKNTTKPASAPHKHTHRHEPIDHQHQHQPVSVKAPQRPKTMRAPTKVRRTQTMPVSTDNGQACAVPPVSFSDGCADLRKKYDHLFTRKAYATSCRKNTPMKRSDSLPTSNSPKDLNSNSEFRYEFGSCI